MKLKSMVTLLTVAISLGIGALYGWAVTVRSSPQNFESKDVSPSTSGLQTGGVETKYEEFSFLVLGHVTVDTSSSVKSWNYLQNYASPIYYGQLILDALPFRVNDTFLLDLFVRSINEFPRAQAMIYRTIHIRRFGNEETDITFSTIHDGRNAFLVVNVVPVKLGSAYRFTFRIIDSKVKDIDSDISLESTNFQGQNGHIDRSKLKLYWESLWPYIFDQTGNRKSILLAKVAELQNGNIDEAAFLSSFKNAIQAKFPEGNDFISEEALSDLLIANYLDNGGNVDLSAFLMLHELANRISIAPM